MKKSSSLFFLLTCGFCYGAETPKVFTLSNGLKVYILRDDSLPYVEYNLILGAGSSKDPKGKEGLASFTAEMLERGTQNNSSLQIIQKLDNLGTELGISTSRDFTLISVETLSWHYKTLLKILAEVITLPSFEEKEISWVKNRVLSRIQKLPESTSSFTNRIVQKTLLQKNNYAHSPLGYKETVQNFNTSDIKGFHQTNFIPQNSILGITGKFPENIRKDLEVLFSKWEKTDQPSNRKKIKAQRWKRERKFPFFQFRKTKIALPQIDFDFSKIKINFIDKKELFQSEIRVAKPFVSRTSPEYILLQMANIILGSSGLDSRLFNAVREQRGLTYVIYSQFLPLMNSGLLNITTSTRLNVTREAVNKIIDVLENFYKNGITEEELNKAKNTYKVQLLKNMETPPDRLLRTITLNSYGLPLDLPTINQELRRIKLEDVNRVIKKYYFLDQVQIFIFSDFNKIKDQFNDIQNKQVFPTTQFL